VCLGFPGVLPVLNRQALEYAMLAALALNCRVAPRSVFARKSYFYPDLPKAYQISQYELPLAEHGFIEIEVEGEKKRIGIRRVHLEEDAGKLLHDGDTGGESRVDFNRSGVPLIEIVSEPDIRSAAEAKAYMMKLRDILLYVGVSDCNMEEGSLRCDANISLRPVGQEELGVKTELKNMNSFRFLQRALEYEIERQKAELTAGREIVQETRLWDESGGVTVTMRTKEEAHDYRYFPEPDLVPVVTNKEWLEELRQKLPELPDEKRERFMREYGLPAYDAELLTGTRELADYYEECVRLFPQPKMVSNWIMSELLRELNSQGGIIQECPVSPKMLAQLLEQIDKGIISGKIGKEVFVEMYRTRKDALSIIQEKGLVQITDEGEIKALIRQVLEQNPSQLAQYRAGKQKLFSYFIGQIMKLSQGKVNPQLANRYLKEILDQEG